MHTRFDPTQEVLLEGSCVTKELENYELMDERF